MFTRAPAGFMSYLKCYSCDIELDGYEVSMYDSYDGLCEECYISAMDAAYDDIKEDDRE